MATSQVAGSALLKIGDLVAADPDRITIGLSNTPLATIQNAGLTPVEKDEV